MAEDKASLILTPYTEEVLTARRDLDARSALLRGCAEYLKKLSIQYKGVETRFTKTFYAWADVEVEAVYPSAYVSAEEAGTYDASQMVPSSQQSMKVANERYIAKTGELVQRFKIDAFVNAIAEGQAFTMMLEDAINPTTWMYGFRLRLPYYHGVHAEYEAVSITTTDDATAVENRLRHINIELVGRLPMYRTLQNADGSVRIVPLKIQSEVVVLDREYASGVADPEFITYVDE
jgi:hypothetical protein